MPLVFQYGSNCTTARLNGPKRLNGHAEDLDHAQTVEDFEIAFDVYSQTNGCAASDLVRVPGRKAWGVLYEIPADFIDGRRADGQKTLEQIEGKRYAKEALRVVDRDGKEQEAVTFLVREAERRTSIATSAAYVSWIVYGLRNHSVPEEYIAHVVDVAIETNQRAGAFADEQIRLIKTL
jgi:cation transport regulator ChaC